MSDSEYLEKVLGSPWRIVGDFFFWLELDLRVAPELWDPSLQKSPKGLCLQRAGCLSGPRGHWLISLDVSQVLHQLNLVLRQLLGSWVPKVWDILGSKVGVGEVSLEPPFLAVL